MAKIIKELTKDDLRVGATYRGKRYRAGLFGGNNDRTIVWMNRELTRVQYDSDTVAIGRRLPIVDIDKFLKWAKNEVRGNDDGD